MITVDRNFMRRTAIIFSQIAIVLIGFCALAVMLWFPHIEGRNAHATFSDVYFKDPFLAYAYLSSGPFFVALYRAFMLLRYVGRNELFSQHSVNALRAIKNCGVMTIGFVALGALWILFSESDDRAGGFALCFVIVFVAVAVAAVASLFEKRLKQISGVREG